MDSYDVIIIIIGGGGTLARHLAPSGKLILYEMLKSLLPKLDMNEGPTPSSALPI